MGGLAASVPLMGAAGRVREPEPVTTTLEATDEALWFDPLPPFEPAERRWYPGLDEHVNCRCAAIPLDVSPADSCAVTVERPIAMWDGPPLIEGNGVAELEWWGVTKDDMVLLLADAAAHKREVTVPIRIDRQMGLGADMALISGYVQEVTCQGGVGTIERVCVTMDCTRWESA